MFPTSNNSSYYEDPNPNSIQQAAEADHQPSFLQYFPSPFLDDHNHHFLNDHQLFPQPNQLMPDYDDYSIDLCATDKLPKNKEDSGKITTPATKDHLIPALESGPKIKAPKQRRRSGKKDRHSKICTAQGLRDRRMRLSLQIARKFFDLQDMLGFDKASKTIDWLFSKSKKAIKQLNCNTKNRLQINNSTYNDSSGENSDSSNSSECEVESGKTWKMTTKSKGDLENAVSSEEKSQRITIGYSNHVVRETRDKARARARERTSKKLMIRCLEKSKHYLSDQMSTNNLLAQLKSCSTAANPNSIFEMGGPDQSMSSLTHDHHMIISPHEYSSLHTSFDHHHHQMGDVGINLEKFLGATTTARGGSSCSIFEYDQKNEDGLLYSGGLDSYSNKYLGFLGNYSDMDDHFNTFSAMTTLTAKSPTTIFMGNSSFQHLIQPQSPPE